MTQLACLALINCCFKATSTCFNLQICSENFLIGAKTSHSHQLGNLADFKLTCHLTTLLEEC